MLTTSPTKGAALAEPGLPDARVGPRGCDGERGLDIEVALCLLLDGARPVAGTERVALAAALGRVTSCPVATSIQLPPFDHSAVDGFGLHASDLDRIGVPLPVRGRVAAGPSSGFVPPAPGTVLRLLTGALVPDAIAAVVMEEQVDRRSGSIALRHPLPPGANIRQSGEDVGLGRTIVEAGTVLDARHLALMAAAGVTAIEAHRRVRVALLSTGDELVPTGSLPLAFGAIHDANRPMLRALLDRPWLEICDVGQAPDDAERLAAMLAEAARHSDVVLSTGGVSGSDADHVLPALRAAGGEGRALRLALKPGKPLVTGRLGGARLLALPGNPVAAFTHFLLFGRPLLQQLGGASAELPRGIAARAAEPIAHRPGRREYLPAALVGEDADGLPRLRAVGRGGSARLRPLSLADGLADIGPERGDLEPGEFLRFHPFATATAL